MKSGKRTASVVLTVALFGITGCGGQGQQPAEQSGPEMTSHESMSSGSAGSNGGDAPVSGKAVITVEDFQYDIPESVSPGETITVVNKDDVPHTVTSKEDGIFDAVFEGGETVTFTAPEEPGEYAFFCVYHPNMTGTLVVE